jgi:hypothetical protein
LKLGKGSKASKDQDIRAFKPEDKDAKTGCSGLGFWMVKFSPNR